MFEKFCNNSVIWDTDTSWNTTSPDLSLCLQSTFLIWIPCLLLWLVFLPLDIWMAARSTRRKLNWSAISICKLFLNVILVILSAIKLSFYSQRYYFKSFPYDIASILGSAVLCFSFITVLIASLYLKQKGMRVSHLLTVFWLLLSIATWTSAYSADHNFDFWWYDVKHYGRLEYALNFCIPVASTLQLILSSFTESNKYRTFERLDAENNEDHCLLASNSFFFLVLFGWMFRTVFRGIRGKLEAADLRPLCLDFRTRKVTKVFESFTRKTVTNEPGLIVQQNAPAKRSLLYLLLCTCWTTFVTGCIFELFNVALAYVAPFMLQKLMTFASSDEPVWHGYLFATVFCFGEFLSGTFYNLFSYCMSIAELKSKTVLTSAIYKKILRLSPSSRQQYPSGEILNLMSTDVDQVYTTVPLLSSIWSAPIRAVVSIVYLWHYLGLSCLAGLVLLVILIPCSVMQANITEKLKVKILSARDDRMKQMSETLFGIKILKLYAWEKPFMKRIMDTRTKELNFLKKTCYLDSLFIFIWFSAPFLVCVACFTCFVLTGHTLDASTAFVSLSIFNILRFPMAMIPHVIVQIITSAVSMRRLQKFLYSEERDPNLIGNQTIEGNAIVLRDVSASWSNDLEESTLKNINLNVTTGSLVAVVGTVGSGKSSIFSALIGDMYIPQGQVDIQGSLAYVPQQAWILNETLQKNILFTKPYGTRKYNKLLDACALRPDIKLLSGGDLTEIGEKGINLSGGQKQRVSLARAAYQEADIYLLDDPLSAVDANVASHIFKELIGPTGFLSKKTRILATHNIAFLPEADHIIVMADGRVAEEGSYADLMASGGAFADLIEQHASNHGVTESTAKEVKDPLMRQVSVLSRTSETGENAEFSALTSEETMETGRVTWAVYANYISSITIPLFLIIFFFCMFASCTDVGSSVWLSKWTSNAVTFSYPLSGLWIYCAFIIIEAVSFFLLYMVLFYGTIKAAAKLYEGMLVSVLKSPLSFFDTTPIGRIMNRFSNDIESVDTVIPWNLGSFLNQFCWLPIICVIMAVSSVYLIIPLVPLMVLYFLILRAYVVTSNQLQRFQSVTTSPIMSSFTETIQGSGSIRAYSVEDYFLNICFQRVDQNIKCLYYNCGCERWLDAALAIISAIITLAVTFITVWERGVFGAGLIGLLLTFCSQLTEGLNWLVKIGAQLESSIVSVERIREFTCLEPEGAWEIESTKPLSDWPHRGEIVFNDFTVAYREGLDPVLREVNLTVEAGSKVGVVGRTGAGKSSLILSLFRIIEPTIGNIVIDDVDIRTIGTHNLRSKLTVIPQDPVLFAVSLRQNLDPWNEYKDDEIWRALEMSHLKSFVTSLDDGLNHMITEGGDNISAGQRQLVCLARALLRKTKVLVLDEATASVDLDTDQLIQETVGNAFADCTVITIAHRLQTIMNCQKILLFSEGRLLENDSPDNLLANTSSQFYSMARDAGLVTDAGMVNDEI